MIDDPNDPSLRSFIDVPPDSPFPIQNLPFGLFRRPKLAASDHLAGRIGAPPLEEWLNIFPDAESR